ncbi:MAG TPA: amidohydrolase [Steroidobacteraceae bacterium]|nr:amidohydrolase [Steroidobacteraceae bacterium]
MSLYAYKSQLLVALIAVSVSPARADNLEDGLKAVDPKVIAWRRDFHQHPELSDQETRTAKIVTAHLTKLGLEVTSGIAHNGVVGFLRTGKPGPTIALRADMDALPVTERVDLPFKSTVKSNYRGEEVGVMQACGHDSHTAVLMGVAEALTGMKGQLRGNVLFVFQPAEEGVPPGQEGGASLMLKEGIFDRYKPEAMIGWHAWATLHVGEIGYRTGPFMADSNAWKIVVNGRQTHGSRPWRGVDPIVVAAQIINALQTVVSRQVDLTEQPAVFTVGAIKGGIRNNIIPDSVEMIGTMRTFSPAMKKQMVENVTRMVEKTAAASGAVARFELDSYNNPVVLNDPKLTARMLPVLRKVPGVTSVKEIPLITGSEDFAYYANKVPSLFYMVGVSPPVQDLKTVPENHSPLFFVDEKAIPIATRALTAVALDYLGGK